MPRLSSPLDLDSHLKKPDMSLDSIPLLNVLLIGLCLVSMGTLFVAAPGELVELPNTPPSAIVPVIDVLTIQHDNMLLFNSRIYTLEEFNRHFQRTSQPTEKHGVLLIKCNRDVSIQTFLEVCSIARNAGFERVQIATKPDPQSKTAWSGDR